MADNRLLLSRVVQREDDLQRARAEVQGLRCRVATLSSRDDRPAQSSAPSSGGGGSAAVPEITALLRRPDPSEQRSSGITYRPSSRSTSPVPEPRGVAANADAGIQRGRSPGVHEVRMMQLEADNARLAEALDAANAQIESIATMRDSLARAITSLANAKQQTNTAVPITGAAVPAARPRLPPRAPRVSFVGEE